MPDLSVDGTIELERLNDVLFMGRPAFGQDQSTVGLFKIDADGVNAERVQVKLGRSSVNTVEVLSGLKVGDQVILSDMSAYDAFDRSQTEVDVGRAVGRSRRARRPARHEETEHG